MQKVLDFLERHVQWVAIAIAAVFLIYALMTYLPGVAAPVTIEQNGKVLGPGEVDPEIKTVADTLQSRIDAPVKITLPVPHYSERFQQELSKTPKFASLPRTIILARSVEYPPNLPWDSASGSTDVASSKVNALPALPPAILEPTPTTDFAQVTPPAIAGAPTVTPVAAPVATPAPAAGDAAAAVPNAYDTTWVRIPYSIPAGNIARAFSNVNLPANLTLTTVLRVELIRQKQLPGNLWGPEELVDVLPTVPVKTLPPEGPASAAAQIDYLQWANSNQGPIVQPDFFPVVAGADPRMSKPDASLTGTAAGPLPFDPETFPAAGMAGGDISVLPLDQQAAVRAVRIRKAKEAQDSKPKPTGGGGGNPGGGRGGRGGRGGGEGFAAPSPASADLGAVTPFQARPGSEFPSEVGTGGMGTGDISGIAGVPTAASAIPITPLPTAPFDPAQVAGGLIQGWAYDTTAAADSTYRYRIRYKLKNPIFGVQNVASKPELISVFSLIGEDANTWTPPITIAPLTHVYLATLPTPGAGKVGFTVFRWQSGKRHRLTGGYFVNVGDSIGKEDASIDYRTHWTLVEVRRDSSAPNAYALIMNADGMLKRLDFDADKASPLFKQLTAEVDGPAVTPTPGTPVGGNYPGGGLGGDAPPPNAGGAGAGGR